MSANCQNGIRVMMSEPTLSISKSTIPEGLRWIALFLVLGLLYHVRRSIYMSDFSSRQGEANYLTFVLLVLCPLYLYGRTEVTIPFERHDVALSAATRPEHSSNPPLRFPPVKKLVCDILRPW
jgi:hypothetical protein